MATSRRHNLLEQQPLKPLVAELNYDRRIGVEHEAAVALIGSGGRREVQETVANVLTANEIKAKARGYMHAPVPYGFDVTVEYDASVQGESRYQGITWHSLELKSKILNGLYDWESIIPKALTIINYLGGKINPTTGYHVHLDFPEAVENPRKIRSLFNLIHRFEPLIYSLVAPSRRQNRYVRPIRAEASRKLHHCRTLRCFRMALADGSREDGLNLTHVFDTIPRIEFRWHHGTLDPEKARHWLRFLNRLLEHSVTRNCQAAKRQVKPSMPAFDNFLMTIGFRSNSGIYTKVAPELRETGKYLRRRFKHFNRDLVAPSGQNGSPQSS